MNFTMMSLRKAVDIIVKFTRSLLAQAPDFMHATKVYGFTRVTARIRGRCTCVGYTGDRADTGLVRARAACELPGAGRCQPPPGGPGK